MKLILCSVTESLSKSWKRFFNGVGDIEIHEGSIFDLSVDAVVSPGNSFGFMDGGIDAAYLQFFGQELERRVRDKISRDHAGELLVGQADLIKTGHSQIPHLIIAPTMRVPMMLVNSVNAYLAARAVFRLVKDSPFSKHEARIALPGLGTGTGQLPSHYCALQVRRAYNDIVLGQFQAPESWAEASERHQLLYCEEPGRLQ